MLTLWHHGVVSSVKIAYKYSAVHRPSRQWRCEDHSLPWADILNCRKRIASIPLLEMWRASKKVGSSEMSVQLYQTVLRQIPEDRVVHTTVLLLTFHISNPPANIQDMNFKMWSIITLHLYRSEVFYTILIPVPCFLIKLVKLNFLLNCYCFINF
jgi:hypothetical protein